MGLKDMGSMSSITASLFHVLEYSFTQSASPRLTTTPPRAFHPIDDVKSQRESDLPRPSR